MALLPQPAPGNNAEYIIYIIIYSLLTNVIYALVLVNVAAFYVVYISETWGLWDKLANLLISFATDNPNAHPKQKLAAEIFLRFSAPPFSFSTVAVIIVVVVNNVTLPAFNFSTILPLFH